MGQAFVSAMHQITTQSQYLFLALRLIKSHCVRLVSFIFFLSVRTHRDSRAINYILYHKYKIKKIILSFGESKLVKDDKTSYFTDHFILDICIIVREKHR